MANPKNLEYPYGWRPVSQGIPDGLRRTITMNISEAARKDGNSWFRPFRGDAISPSLVFTPSIQRTARYPRPQLRGDIREV